MPLREEFEKQGNWLFVRRSWFPLIFVPLMLLALFDYGDVLIHLGFVWHMIFQIICVLISLTGLFIRAIAIGYAPAGTSGRNTTEGQIAEQLNTKGIYSTVRHPLYLGNFLIFLGFTLYTQSIWFNFLAILGIRIYYERIMYAEEEFLRKKYGKYYEDWALTTPAFMPKLSKWQKPELPFSFKNVLKREYTAFFEITLIFPLLDHLGTFLNIGILIPNYFWLAVMAAGFVIYFVLRTIKKKTRLLDVDGR